jgi:predicted nuclease of predicted toxin-antitoxin system
VEDSIILERANERQALLITDDKDFARAWSTLASSFYDFRA